MSIDRQALPPQSSAYSAPKPSTEQRPVESARPADAPKQQSNTSSTSREDNRQAPSSTRSVQPVPSSSAVFPPGPRFGNDKMRPPPPPPPGKPASMTAAAPQIPTGPRGSASARINIVGPKYAERVDNSYRGSNTVPTSPKNGRQDVRRPPTAETAPRALAASASPPLSAGPSVSNAVWPTHKRLSSTQAASSNSAM